MASVKVYFRACISLILILAGTNLSTGLQCYFCIYYETTAEIPQPGYGSQETCKEGRTPHPMFLTTCGATETNYIRLSNLTNNPVDFVNEGEDQPRFTWTCGKFTMDGEINNASFIGILRSCVGQRETETVTGCAQKPLRQLEAEQTIVNQTMDYFRSRNITISPESMMAGCTCTQDKCNSYVNTYDYDTGMGTSMWKLPGIGALLGTLIFVIIL